MNSATRYALEKFIDEVGHLARGVHHDVGSQQVEDTLNACEDLKRALDKDETIRETGT